MPDLMFTDLLGPWQHCTFAIDEWNEETFVHGGGFDGSSTCGWQDIHVSDMLAVPDVNTTVIDPFFAEPTLPRTLRDSINHLEHDYGFLTAGGVFTEDVIERVRCVHMAIEHHPNSPPQAQEARPMSEMRLRSTRVERYLSGVWFAI